ncbi:MAG: hypothetical protein KGI66_05095, partial [Patescibacteria group bacterium]|nr:hypothetical protein [Patescibacteria group bacterium]
RLARAVLLFENEFSDASFMKYTKEFCPSCDVFTITVDGSNMSLELLNRLALVARSDFPGLEQSAIRPLGTRYAPDQDLAFGIEFDASVAFRVAGLGRRPDGYQVAPSYFNHYTTKM